MHICGGNSLSALASLGYHDHCSGLPLPNFILRKLCLQCITLVAHEIELGGAKVVLGLSVLEDVKFGIVHIHPDIANILALQVFFREGNNANLAPRMCV